MGKASREKGKRGERELAGILKSYGYNAKRGMQYHGGPESPDVVGLPNIHIEVKRVERLNLDAAIDQSVTDAGDDELATVFHRKNGGKWNVTMPMEDWMKLYEGRFDRRHVCSTCGNYGYKEQENPKYCFSLRKYDPHVDVSCEYWVDINKWGAKGLDRL